MIKSLMLFAFLTGCAGKNLKVEAPIEAPQFCGPEFMIEDIVSTTGCSEVILFKDPEMPIIYGACADAGDEMISSIAMPSELYFMIKDSVEKDGGIVICSDDVITIIRVPFLN